MFEFRDSVRNDADRLRQDIETHKACLSEMEKQLDAILADQALKAKQPESTGLFSMIFDGPKKPVQPTHLIENLPMRLKIIGAMGEERHKLIDCMAFGDEGFVQRCAISMLRSKRMHQFEGIKDQVHEYARMIQPTIRHNEAFLRKAGIEVTPPELFLLGIRPDRNTSLANDAWCNHMDQAYEQLELYMQGLESHYDKLADLAYTIH